MGIIGNDIIALVTGGVLEYEDPFYPTEGESIIEQIAQWLAAAIAEITEANGYHQTLDVSRPEDAYIEGDKSYNDLSAVINQSDCEEPDKKTQEEYFWRQIFEIDVYLLADVTKALGVKMDTRINRIAADIYKRMGFEMLQARANKGRLCNGLAYRGPSACPIELIPPVIIIAPYINSTIVKVPIGIFYEFDATNPYNQI